MADVNSVVHLWDEKRSRHPLDHCISMLADRQHGVVARYQLLDFAGRGEVDGRIRRGALHPVHRGVYSVGRTGLGRKGMWMAAALAGGPSSVLSRRSAGALLGLLRMSGRPIEITRARGWRAPMGVVVHRRSLCEDEVEEVDGIPVTSVSRTLFDLAAVVDQRELERALNEAEVRRLTSRVSLPTLLERYPRRRGAAVLRALLRDADASKGVTCSELEERFAALIEAHGLPKPRRNADLAVRGRFFKVDCLWRQQGVIVELDGRAVHGTAGAFEADRERDRLLVGEGWKVLHLTWLQLRDEAPEIVADLRRAL